MNKTKKLWHKKDIKIDQFTEAFETKGDLVLDQKLVEFDIVGSIAHAEGLKKIGIFTEKELKLTKKGLQEILDLNQQGKFILEPGDEDIHTKIENYLTQKYGSVGQKIHTGRSRNDQVLTALGLYSKAQLEQIKSKLLEVQISFGKFAQKYGQIPMPGYTHMQKAMPSTISLWIGSFIDAFEDDLMQLDAVYKLNDQSPLGSAAGYGLPIKLEKEYTAKLMGFSKVQENPIYCQNSRLKIEASNISNMISILMDVNKFASDVLLFTTSEFNYFTPDDSISTGSSIMPQKKNLDLAELLRSKVSLVLGNYVQIISLGSNLISGYNRDFQDSKKPLMESFEITIDSLKALDILINNLEPNQKALEKAMSSELFATEKALDLVQKGVPFREAYQKIGEQYRMKGGESNENKN